MKKPILTPSWVENLKMNLAIITIGAAGFVLIYWGIHQVNDLPFDQADLMQSVGQAVGIMVVLALGQGAWKRHRLRRATPPDLAATETVVEKALVWWREGVYRQSGTLILTDERLIFDSSTQKKRSEAPLAAVEWRSVHPSRFSATWHRTQLRLGNREVEVQGWVPRSDGLGVLEG